MLPTLWFRNQWSWTSDRRRAVWRNCRHASANHRRGRRFGKLGEQRYLYCEGVPSLLFTENETNTQRIFGVANRSPYVKDGINDYVVNEHSEAVNPACAGTKVARALSLTVAPGEVTVLALASVRCDQPDHRGGWCSDLVRRSARFETYLTRQQGSRRVLRDRHPSVAQR